MSATETTSVPPPYSSNPAGASAGVVQSSISTMPPTTLIPTLNEKASLEGGPKQYLQVFPLAGLSRFPAPIDCPVCKQRAMTQTKFIIGGTTHILAFSAFAMTGVLFWLPYLLKNCKNVQHYCGSCGVLLATWHRSGVGNLEMHQFS